jgi:hypothetical protein
MSVNRASRNLDVMELENGNNNEGVYIAGFEYPPPFFLP